MRGQPLRIQQVYEAIDAYILNLPEGATITQGDVNVMLGKKDLSASGATLSKAFQTHVASGTLTQVTRQLFRREVSKPSMPHHASAPGDEPIHYGFKDRLELLEAESRLLQARLVRVEKRLGIE